MSPGYFDETTKHELAETANALKDISGGAEVLALFGGSASFHDAEVVSLTLDRAGGSRLVLHVPWKDQWFTIGFHLNQWIDIDLKGFSRQNVINQLVIRRAGERQIHDMELGVGIEPGDFEMILAPCYGAYGSIRAGIAKIEFLGSKS